jgi:hypothetical protein
VGGEWEVELQLDNGKASYYWVESDNMIEEKWWSEVSLYFPFCNFFNTLREGNLNI